MKGFDNSHSKFGMSYASPFDGKMTTLLDSQKNWLTPHQNQNTDLSGFKPQNESSYHALRTPNHKASNINKENDLNDRVPYQGPSAQEY